ncbi:MAG: alpha/beta hydrolase [Chitinivorax sp.]
MRDIIHFSHANGFPAAAYRKMFGYLERDYDLGYINAIGHDPRFPVTDCWPNLIEELILYMEQHYDRPVIAVGHSLGGFLSFFTALRRPDLFKAIVLLDSPIMGHMKSTMLAVAKRFGVMERITPAGACRARRREWESAEAAVSYFRGKPLFRHFDADCLRDYARNCTVPNAEGGVRLLFNPEIEYLIYCHLPHTYPAYRRKLQVPAGFLGGRDSHLVNGFDVRNMQRNHGIVCRRLDGGHLFPLEHPQQAAEQIHRMIQRLLQRSTTQAA